METPMARGDGWRLFKDRDGDIRLKFNHAPDNVTIKALKSLAEWDHILHEWRIHPISVDAALSIAQKSTTWESVGEEPPSVWDDCEGEF